VSTAYARVAAGFVFLILGGVANAWVLLIEILR
jgi:hypothetical protein